MKTTTNRLVLFLVLVLCGSAVFVVSAQDDRDTKARHDSESALPARHADNSLCNQACLGRTVRLEFKIVGPEEEPTFSVLSAGGIFSIEHDASAPDHEHSLRIIGELHPVDAEDSLLIKFAAMTRHHDVNEGFEGTFNLKGSARLRLGKSLKLGDLGDQTLMLSATEEE